MRDLKSDSRLTKKLGPRWIGLGAPLITRTFTAERGEPETISIYASATFKKGLQTLCNTLEEKSASPAISL